MLPVTLWDPDPNVVEACQVPGVGLWVVAAVQRRFWSGTEGRRSRLELVAQHIETHDTDNETGGAGQPKK